MRSFLCRHFVALVGVLALTSYIALYAARPGMAPIRSDGYSYYVYLPSWFLYHDATLASVANDCCGGTFPGFTAIVRWPATGRWVDAHPIGVAVLSSPFFGLAHLLTRWSNLTPDGFSLYYQHGAGLAGLAYMLLGLAILRRLLQQHFSDSVVLATLATITFGTNLFHYGVYESTFSHVFSFCLICGLLALTERWWTSPRWLISAALGGVAGLVVLVRHPNALFLLAVPMFGLASWGDVAGRATELWERRAHLLVAAAAMAVCLAPQLALYRLATGSWVVNAYGRIGPAWSSPHVLGVLFSVQKGLFFWSPALLLAVIGLFVARGWTRRWRVAAVTILAIQTSLVASWFDWQLGGSYGHRGFTDTLGFFAIFVAACFAFAAERPRLARAAAVVASAAVALSIVQMVQYWLGVIPTMDTTWQQYRGFFLRF